MKEIIYIIKAVFTILGGFIGGIFGGFDGFLYALAVFVVADYFTGVLAAGVQKKISSEIGFEGIAKKVTIFVLVAIANMVDVYVVQTANVTRTAVIFFFLSNEGISVLENAAVIGLPIPKQLKQRLLQINKESDSDGD